MSDPPPARRPQLKRWLLLAALLALVGSAFVLPTERWLLRLADWIRGAGVTGALVYSAVYIGGTLLLLPGSILTLAAGFAYGPLWGTLLVWPTATVAACASFVVARFFARDWVSRKVNRNAKFSAVDRAIGKQGFKIVLLLRLSPLFPFNFLNYALGLSKISFARYAAASLLGMLPGTAMYVYLGSLVTSASRLAEGTSSDSPAQSALYWGGLLATVVVTVVITRISRRALASEIQQAEESEPA